MTLPLFTWDELRERGISAGFTGAGDDHRGNTALHAGGSREEALTNRKELCRMLNVPFSSYTCAEQIHSSHVQRVGREHCGRGRLNHSDALPETDALITNEPGILLNIFVADCVPVILYDDRTRSGGLCHAGWRGTIGEIVPKAVRAMGDHYGSRPGDIQAYIGPSIGGCCYEVGSGVEEAFREFPFIEMPIGHEKDKSFLDLKKANREMLTAAGVSEENITLSPLCTVCGTTPLFSYRKDGKETGRFSAFFYLFP
ncbi:MAG: peptidoglycan editing factor PgeF [Spirochaetales bacterium]|nr:peptidoglycan editing factor PgeF [Spirochaetales bacterium]